MSHFSHWALASILSLSLCGSLTTPTFGQSGPLLVPDKSAPALNVPSRPDGRIDLGQPTTPVEIDAETGPGMSVVIHESFLSKWIKRTTSKCGPVRAEVAKAQVYGGQCTNSVSDVELIESPDSVRFVIVLSGSTRNQTVSYARQAAISSRGLYGFKSWKHVEFDGQQMKSWTPQTVMNIHHENVAASTRFDRMPIFGAMASRSALRAADRHEAEAHQSAMNRMNRQVISEFDERVESQLAQINDKLESDIATLLNQLHVDQESISARSLKNHIVINVGGDAGALAQTKFDESTLPSAGISFRVHQSYLNQLIASLPLAGLEIPDTVFDQLKEVQRTEPVSFGGPKFGSLILADQMPLSISLQNGLIVVQATVGFRPVFGPDLPLHRVVLHLRPQLAGQHLSFAIAIDQLKAIDSEETTVFELRLDSFNRMLATNSPFPPLPVRIPLRDDNPNSPEALAVTSLQINQGWMQLALDATDLEDIEVVGTDDNPIVLNGNRDSREIAASSGE